jgi:hypothetical protein
MGKPSETTREMIRSLEADKANARFSDLRDIAPTLAKIDRDIKTLRGIAEREEARESIDYSSTSSTSSTSSGATSCSGGSSNNPWSGYWDSEGRWVE